LQQGEFEVVKGSVDVAPHRTGPRAAEADLNLRRLADMRVPRTAQPHDGAVGLNEFRVSEIFEFALPALHRLALREQTAAHSFDSRHVLQPEREVQQVHAQVEQTSAAGQTAIATPGFVRPIRIVKSQIDGDDLSQFAFAQPSP
jgi:hypothetical protein